MSLKILGRITVATVLLTTLGLGLFMVATWSVQDALYPTPELHVTSGLLPDISAQAWLVLDLESGTEIASVNSTAVLPIASITKLMTAAVFRQETNLVGTTTITWSDVLAEGRAGKLEAYQEYPYRELVYALLLESSNDAAAAIARVAPETVANMNEFVKTNGFSQTVFVDTSGLSSSNQSTAYEVAKLTLLINKTQPHLFDITSLSQLYGTHTGWINNNPLSELAGFKGGKNGFTYAADRTAVAIITEPISGTERDFVYVILGSSSLMSDTEQLQQYVRKHVTYE